MTVINNNNTSEERRTLERKKLNLNKIFKSEITFNNQTTNCFVYIVDVSEGGMKIHVDFPLPDNIEFKIKFYLDEPLEVTAKMIWQKTLVGGMNVAGISFVTISDDDKEKINRFIFKYSPEGKRKSFRLNRVLAVETTTEGLEEKFYALTYDMSPKGMRISTEQDLEEAKEYDFRILLDFDKPPISVKGKIVWLKENFSGNNSIGIEFLNISDENAARINNFIEAVFSGKLDDQVPQHIPIELDDDQD